MDKFRMGLRIVVLICLVVSWPLTIYVWKVVSPKEKQIDFRRGELSAQTEAYTFLKRYYDKETAEDYRHFLECRNFKKGGKK